MLAFTFIVMILTTARLTRLVVTDSITSRIRVWLFKRWPPVDTKAKKAHPLGVLINCGWCVSVYMAGATVLVASYFVNVPMPLITWPATAEAAALLITWLDS